MTSKGVDAFTEGDGEDIYADEVMNFIVRQVEANGGEVGECHAYRQTYDVDAEGREIKDFKYSSGKFDIGGTIFEVNVREIRSMWGGR